MMHPQTHKYLRPFTKDSALKNFVPLPRGLFDLDLTPSAVLLYALLLDRATLSQRSRWHDKAGWVYIHYTVADLTLVLRKGESTIRRLFAELEEQELIFRTRPVPGDPNWIFLRVPMGCVEEREEDKTRAVAELSTAFSAPFSAQNQEPPIYGGRPLTFESGTAQKQALI